MSNRRLLLESRVRDGIRSSTQTLIEDIRLFGNTIPKDFLEMDRQGFQRHFNKLYQTHYIFTCMYIDQLQREQVLKDYQIDVIRGFFPEFGM